MRHYLLVCLLLLSPFARADTVPPPESRKIEYLITAIESLQNAEFIRNGTAYDGKSAADHLRLKLQKAGSRVETAEDFIRICASMSSVSGEPYRIRFFDGGLTTSEAYLRQKLAEFANEHPDGG